MATNATVTAYEGPCFALLDPSGDIPPDQEYGLYYEDTRFLSRHTLRLDGATPLVLAARSESPPISVHFLTNPALPGVLRGTLTLRRTYTVSHGAHVDIDVTSYASSRVVFNLELAYDADFADVFQIKQAVEARPAERATSACVATFGKTVLALSRAEQGWSRRTEVRFSAQPRFDERTAIFRVELDPGQRFHLCQDIYAIAEGDFVPPRRLCSEIIPLEDLAAESAPIDMRPPGQPVLESDSNVARDAFECAIADLYALRIRHLDESARDFHLAAGIPWFMALFGRDSLIAAYQAMTFLPDLARGALRSLARWQGRRDDPETEEQPGKILDEHRPANLLGARHFVPRFPYYGSVDATPLFVVTLSELWRRTGDLEFLRSLEPNLVAACEWIVRHGDADRDGFLSYRRSTSYGLTNQGWKDSEDSVRFHDGTFGEPPIALIEVQGYACDALVRAAEVYRVLGRPEAEAEALATRAAAMPEAIDRAYWLEDRAFWAMAVDGQRRRVDALTSNPAHLLWSGAVLDHRAEAAAHQLLAADLFSGFGVRTMGTREAAYNPISYHNGSVWPHDTSIAAAGLARYGRRREAATLCEALLDAASHYDHFRLPELFAGFARSETPFPVEYPTANSPQAWAAGAVLLATAVMLGFSIDVPRRRIAVAPALPAGFRQITLRGVEVGGARVDVHVERRGEAIDAEVRGAPSDYTVIGTHDPSSG